MIGRRRPREATRDVKVNIVDPTTFGVRRRITGELNFKEADPFAINLTFFDKLMSPAPIRWCLSRELLIGGITMPDGAGFGDIAIWPLAWDDFRSYIGMILGTGAEAITMTTRMKPVHKFMRIVDRIVPLDKASDHVDMEKELIWLQQKMS